MKKNEEKSIKIIAHRGNSAFAPENSRSAFLQALDLAVDFLECDVQLSRDGIPVIMHDGCFTRITKKLSLHEVDSIDFDVMSHFDIGKWFDEGYSSEKLLSLKEFLELSKESAGMMLDIKEESVKERELTTHIVKEIVEFSHANPHHTPLVVGSLNPNILYCFEGFLPEQQLIAIVRTPEQLKEFEPIVCRYYALYYPLANKRLIDFLHEREIEVWAWVVDDHKIARKLIDDGIDGLITNMPQKMLRYRKLPFPNPRKHYANGSFTER